MSVIRTQTDRNIEEQDTDKLNQQRELVVKWD